MNPIAITVLVTGLALGCGSHHDHDHNGHPHDHDDDGHAHEAPNGGVLVELGKDACYLEFLLDESNATRMTLLAYEFHPQEAYVKLPMSQIEVMARVGDEEEKLMFKPVVSATLGNNATHSAEHACKNGSQSGCAHSPPRHRAAPSAAARRCNAAACPHAPRPHPSRPASPRRPRQR